MTIFVTTHYMDEAEYCERVGVMRDGKLLAMDTPTNLKSPLSQGMSGKCTRIRLNRGWKFCHAMEGVERVGLAGDHLRVISSTGRERGDAKPIKRESISVEKIERGEPTLEDVFLRWLVEMSLKSLHGLNVSTFEPANLLQALLFGGDDCHDEIGQ